MRIAHVHIQCTYPGTDKTGCFLKNKETGKVESPLFPDLVALSKWEKANGWYQSAPGLGAPMANDSDE